MVTRFAKGINFYSTPGHGGFHLSAKLNKLVPIELRQASWGGLGLKGWYEEDCDWSIPALIFAAEFAADQRDPERTAECLEAAVDTFRNWKPTMYEQYFGVVLAPDRAKIAALFED